MNPNQRSLRTSLGGLPKALREPRTILRPLEKASLNPEPPDGIGESHESLIQKKKNASHEFPLQ
jgi:hypothetical protein